MTLKSSLRDLEQAFSAPIGDGFKFAYRVSSAAAEVCEYIWEERTEKDVVQDKVLPLMKDACRLIKEVYPIDREGIFEIMIERTNNLKRYLRGERSDFARAVAPAA